MRQHKKKREGLRTLSALSAIQLYCRGSALHSQLQIMLQHDRDQSVRNLSKYCSIPQCKTVIEGENVPVIRRSDPIHQDILAVCVHPNPFLPLRDCCYPYSSPKERPVYIAFPKASEQCCLDS